MNITGKRYFVGDEEGSFDSMKKVEEEFGLEGPTSGQGDSFIRQGISGGYKEELSPKLVAFINGNVRDIITNFSFNYEMDLSQLR